MDIVKKLPTDLQKHCLSFRETLEENIRRRWVRLWKLTEILCSDHELNMHYSSSISETYGKGFPTFWINFPLGDGYYFFFAGERHTIQTEFVKGHCWHVGVFPNGNPKYYFRNPEYQAERLIEYIVSIFKIDVKQPVTLEFQNKVPKYEENMIAIIESFNTMMQPFYQEHGIDTIFI